MRISRGLLYLFSFILLISVASAQTYTVSPTGSNDQNVINAALTQAAQTGTADNPSTVYLNSGTYWVTGTCIIGSNTILTGASDAIICVSSSSSQWFTGPTGIISCNKTVHHVKIHGFQVTGNCQNLDNSLANSRSDTDHDCERCIILHGSSGDYASDIQIYDMTLYNSFSDGVYIYYAQNVKCYNNLISNCQHEGIFWSVVLESEEYNNKIAGITSDDLRLDNCVNCTVHDNVLFSYNGTDNNGAYKHGENGIQVGNAGSSHGYNAVDKPTTTTNIEIYNNIFSNVGLEAITGSMGTNVYIHNNQFIGESKLETMGIPVELLNGSFNETNSPSLDMSKKIFPSIFDILNTNFVDTGITNQTSEDIIYQVKNTSIGRIAGGIKIVGFNNTIKIGNVSYIPNVTSILVKSIAIKSPDYTWSKEGVDNIDKNISSFIDNGTAHSYLNISMRWYKLSKNSKGNYSKSYKTATASFNDSKESPSIYNAPTSLKGTLVAYPIYDLAYVPSDNLTKIVYDYDGSTVEHVFMVGERETDENGVEYTNYTRVNYWEGVLPHIGESAYISVPSFDPEKLTVTAYTPYSSFQVVNFTYVKQNILSSILADWVLPYFGVLAILCAGGWYYLKKLRII